jgi:hypothetical protein
MNYQRQRRQAGHDQAKRPPQRRRRRQRRGRLGVDHCPGVAGGVRGAEHRGHPRLVDHER